MPSMDVVSEVDQHELANAVDQASREVGTRFDFKGTDSTYRLDGERIVMVSGSDFQLRQMQDILHGKMAKRGIDVACLEAKNPQPSGKNVSQEIIVHQGLESTLAKKLVKLIKDSKLKVQAAIQGDKLRVSGKKRDDLQQVIALLRDSDCGLPLQFNNFRD